MYRPILRYASAAAAIGTVSWGASVSAATIAIQVFDGMTLIGSATDVSGGVVTATGVDSNFNVTVTSHGQPIIPNPDFSTPSIQAKTTTGAGMLQILAAH